MKTERMVWNRDGSCGVGVGFARLCQQHPGGERGDQVDLSVHAIEMVYVAEGSFYVGSGGEESGSFTDGDWSGGATIPLAITGGDAGSGLLRVGIVATNGATRVTVGASYWGIMELSGNLWERPVSVGHATGRLFQGSHGTGTLDLPSDWPQANADGTGLRGGNWGNTAVYLRVSDRFIAAHDLTDRLINGGGRAGRSAPSGVGD